MLFLVLMLINIVVFYQILKLSFYISVCVVIRKFQFTYGLL